MPGMRGPELAVRLRSSRPGLRVLLVSGYAEEIVEGGRDASLPFLAKPFSAESLLNAVDAALGTAEPEAAANGDLGPAEPDESEAAEAAVDLVASGPRPKGVAR
jgi:FixJ family two-component response regulator